MREVLLLPLPPQRAGEAPSDPRHGDEQPGKAVEQVVAALSAATQARTVSAARQRWLTRIFSGGDTLASPFTSSWPGSATKSSSSWWASGSYESRRRPRTTTSFAS